MQQQRSGEDAWLKFVFFFKADGGLCQCSQVTAHSCITGFMPPAVAFVLCVLARSSSASSVASDRNLAEAV